MKQLYLIFLCTALQGSDPLARTDLQETQKEAIDVVAAISENLAALIIHHKKQSDPELTKQHSVELVKSITQAIVLCITNAKNKHNTKSVTLYDPATLDAMTVQIAESITQLVQKEEIYDNSKTIC